MIRWLINLLFPRPIPIAAPEPVESKPRSAPDEYWENRWSH